MKEPVLCIVGLGYVGLPLAHAFAMKAYKTLGYDISEERINALQKGDDWTNELSKEQLEEAKLTLSSDPSIIGQADIVILALPTPVDDQNNPDLTILREATKTVGKYLKKGMIVVYESTVYPGVTEEICGTILEEESGLKHKADFHLGYSPERINPGDKTHTISKIVKIVAGDDEDTTDTLEDLYGSIVESGIHRAPSIKVAEMAKAIENAQRDLNIAFVNEIAILCNKIGIRSKDVLEAAGTKWNFLKFQPGLVGGHCIGVDPFYLVEKAKQLGMQTNVITAGRAINDNMSSFIASLVADALPGDKKASRVLVLGLTFKENIPDTRNSKSFDVVRQLAAHGCTVEVSDPFAFEKDLVRWKLTPGSLESGPYDAILLLVPHKEFLETSAADYAMALKDHGVFFDLKSIFNAEDFTKEDKKYLSL